MKGMITNMSQPMFAHNDKAVLIKRVKNSSTYEDKPYEFKCRIATKKEVRSYQILNGLYDENVSISLFTQDTLPVEIAPNDKVIFKGQVKIVASTGVYLDKTRNLAQDLFDDDYIIENAPKGIMLL